MDWQEFLRSESGTHGLSMEHTETLLVALFSPEKAPRNQVELSVKLSISEATVKQRLGEIYKKFGDSFPELSDQQGAGKLRILQTKLIQKYYQQSQPVVPPYPEEFLSLIEEKIRRFCGRQFVFETFEQFITDNPHGYFTIVGDAGMGKSSIVAKYVWEHKSPCYFNILVERRNRPELFLKSIRRQLIDRYQLPSSEDADLPTLLAKVAGQLTLGDRLVIAIDALDEVEQEPGGNLLYLPKNLPNNVYFLLTRRPYSSEKKQLLVDVPVKELDLRDKEYVDFNQEDIKEYIRYAINRDPEYKDKLKEWIQRRSIFATNFVEQVATKSENNFMYLRYVLPAIAKGDYNDLSLTQLPDGLQEYYQSHWVRMGMEAKPGQLMEIVLYILLEIGGTPIPCEMIAGIAEKGECHVAQILENKWVEYLKKQDVEGEICYTIYHASFLDFLKGKREMDSKRKIFKEVNQRIAEYLEEGMG